MEWKGQTHAWPLSVYLDNIVDFVTKYLYAMRLNTICKLLTVSVAIVITHFMQKFTMQNHNYWQ